VLVQVQVQRALALAPLVVLAGAVERVGVPVSVRAVVVQ